MSGAPSSWSTVWTGVLDAASAGPGTALLDVGCGEGALCACAAARGALVHGIDVEPDAIAVAVERVPRGDFRIGMMEALPWPDAAFDVVTGLNAFQYAMDVDDALQEARRVTRPGGRVVACKWGAPSDNELMGYLRSLTGAGGPDEALAAPDPVDDAIARSRLTVVATGEIPLSVDFDDDASLARALGAAGIDATPAALAAAGPHRREDGGYRFSNRMRLRVLQAAR